MDFSRFKDFKCSYVWSFPLKTKRRSLMIKHRGLNSRKFRVFPQSLCFKAVSYYMVIIGTWIWGHLAQPALFYVHFTTFLYLEIQLPKTNFHQLGLSWSKQTYCRTKVKNKNAQAWHSKHMDISTRRLSVPGKPGFKATGLTQKSQVILLLAIPTHFNCHNLTEFYIDDSTNTQSRRLSGNHAKSHSSYVL